MYAYNADFGHVTISKTILQYPVTLRDVKDHLNIEPDFFDKDFLIEGYIQAATEEAESFINKSIAETSCVAQIWDFAGDYFEIKEGNFKEITNIISDASALVTQDADNSHPYNNYFTVTLSASVSSDPLTVNFKTGFAPADVPMMIKQAIMLKVSDYYDVERSSYSLGSFKNNGAFERLLSKYKNMTIIC